MKPNINTPEARREVLLKVMEQKLVRPWVAVCFWVIYAVCVSLLIFFHNH